jgi:hypothetical protein
MSTDHTARKNYYPNRCCVNTASRTCLAEINRHGPRSRLRNLDWCRNQMRASRSPQLQPSSKEGLTRRLPIASSPLS